MSKITIVGAGNVGSQAAFYSALKGIKDIVIIDIIEGLAEGKALDIEWWKTQTGHARQKILITSEVNKINALADANRSEITIANVAGGWSEQIAKGGHEAEPLRDGPEDFTFLKVLDSCRVECGRRG